MWPKLAGRPSTGLDADGETCETIERDCPANWPLRALGRCWVRCGNRGQRPGPLPGTTEGRWWESNPRPDDYKSPALPLRHTGGALEGSGP